MADRRSLRTRKVSDKLAVVDQDARQRARVAKLDALENDAAALDDFELHDSDDEEFVLGEGDSEEEGEQQRKKRKKSKNGGGKRKTRGTAIGKGRGPQSFKEWIEEEGLEEAPDGEPTYLTATCKPPRTRTPRSYCSVCGQLSPYMCTRCGARYCSLRCSVIHSDTRCLKFMS